MVRRYLLIGSLLGAAGVALGAAAAHAEVFSGLQNVSTLMIIHAVLLVSISLHGTLTIPLRLGAACIAFGITLFASDLTVHAVKGAHIFSHAAPIGGSAMIIGWLILALGAFKLRA